MPDREKVINAIDICLGHGTCNDCGYHASECYTDQNCRGRMLRDALALLREQELAEPKVSEWLEDSDPGEEYGTTWACRKCMHGIHKPFIWNPYDSGYKYCFHCGARMEVRLNA